MTYHLNFELEDDPIVSLRDDLAAERRRLEISERAEMEHRVVNRDLWLANLAISRAIIREKESLLDELLALEESAAELAEDMREPEAV